MKISEIQDEVYANVNSDRYTYGLRYQIYDISR